MKVLKKGMLAKNNKKQYSEITYISQKRNLVILSDGSRYGYNYFLSFN